MAIHDIYSKRQRRLRGEEPDLFSYDDIPKELRVQVQYILRDAAGDPDSALAFYGTVRDALLREYGKLYLAKDTKQVGYDLAVWLLDRASTDQVLDYVEFAFQLLCDLDAERMRPPGRMMPVGEAVAELNARFRQHGVGYQFESGGIIRVDSQYVHAEVVRPALAVLSAPMYEGANDEFRKAHEHYRHENYKESLNECAKSFESVMKAICTKRAWPCAPNDTAQKLIGTCFSNGLVPEFLQSQFTGLRACLEGVATLRNKRGAHGQGTEPTDVPRYLAEYQLHQTASVILLLAEAEEALG